MQKITCGYIEHEPPGASILTEFIGRIGELELVWGCDYQENAHTYFEQIIPDLLFITLRQLPVQVEPILRPILMHHPGIIITTAFSRNSMPEIPFPFFDYLQKPIPFPKFKNSVEAYIQWHLQNKNTTGNLSI